jgi:2-C-methyl-D-erythritol 4-phosphate cytidylyltransferase
MGSSAVIVAAGKSERFGGSTPKQFQVVCGRPLLAWTISRFEAASSIDRIMVVVAEEAILYTSRKVVDPYGFSKVVKIVSGGETRRESVWNGLNALPISTELVAIHDGARPLVASGDINRVVSVAASERAAILAIPATDAIKHVKEGFVLNTLRRDSLYQAQTPQVFRYDLIMAAHREVEADPAITDDAALIEARGFKVRVVEPSSVNLKITARQDLLLAEAVLRREIDG